ncbi:MAG: hypothetical protein IPG76_00335 [Acidobacteria bacterium]|nr:hypothetical protein [Acidobacteriota bacterium]
MLSRTGLELDELKQLISTRFIGAGLAITNLHQCKTSQMAISGLTEAHLDRIHRFIRLWKRMGSWSIPLLDSAIVAVNTTRTSSSYALDGVVLHGLARLKRLQQRLGISLESLLALRQPLFEGQRRSTRGGTTCAISVRVTVYRHEVARGTACDVRA